MKQTEILSLKNKIIFFLKSEKNSAAETQMISNIEAIFEIIEKQAAFPKKISAYIKLFETIAEARIELYKENQLKTRVLFADALRAVHIFLWTTLTHDAKTKDELITKRDAARATYDRFCFDKTLQEKTEILNEKAIAYFALSIGDDDIAYKQEIAEKLNYSPLVFSSSNEISSLSDILKTEKTNYQSAESKKAKKRSRDSAPPFVSEGGEDRIAKKLQNTEKNKKNPLFSPFSKKAKAETLELFTPHDFIYMRKAVLDALKKATVADIQNIFTDMRGLDSYQTKIDNIEFLFNQVQADQAIDNWTLLLKEIAQLCNKTQTIINLNSALVSAHQVILAAFDIVARENKHHPVIETFFAQKKLAIDTLKQMRDNSSTNTPNEILAAELLVQAFAGQHELITPVAIIKDSSQATSAPAAPLAPTSIWSQFFSWSTSITSGTQAPKKTK